jgi:hypothetical protein
MSISQVSTSRTEKITSSFQRSHRGMIAAASFGEEAHGVAKLECLALYISLCDKFQAARHGLTCISPAITCELSTLPPPQSRGRWIGTVPADSMSQLVNVRLPN